MSLRVRIIGIGLTGLACVAGVAWGLGPLVGATSLYPAWATTAFALVMALAVAGSGTHPFPVFGPANLVTTVRAGLLALLVGLVGQPVSVGMGWAAVLLAVAAITLDGADGTLARRTGLASAFGARFDMETDAALVMALSVLIWMHGKAGAWVLLGGIARYLFIASGWVWSWMRGSLSPTFRAKLVAIVHLSGLTTALAPIVVQPYSAVAAAVTLAALLWSFGVDVGRLRRAADVRA